MCSTCAHFRIVRNKAAEKVKEIGGYESSSPGPLSNNLGSDTSLPLRHPSYSINNILGVQQAPDANENILKRKRDDDGMKEIEFKLIFYFLTFSIQRRTRTLPASWSRCSSERGPSTARPTTPPWSPPCGRPASGWRQTRR